jgi:threonine dehydrogenase-like Zn-dependent dehydrogenase
VRLSRAVVLETFGAPLSVREFPVPEPAPGDLVVAVGLAGICGTDLHLRDGHLPIPTPVVLGHEGLGVVHALGEGVSTDANGDPLRVGDTVMWASSISCGRCTACRQHREPTLCANRRTYGVNRATDRGQPLSGAWADHIYLESGTTVVKLPPGVDPLVAMSLACAGPTVVHALRERRPPRLGESVIVQGSGPVGLAAAALAHLAGAAPVVVLGAPAGRLELARGCGIGDVHIDIEKPDALAAALAHTPRGEGADLVIECAGAPVAVAQGLRLPRRGGSYLVIGQYTDAGDTPMNPHQIVYRQLDVIGSWAFTGAHLVEYVNLLPTLAARFDLARLVTPFPLAEADAAIREVAAGAVIKAVLRP